MKEFHLEIVTPDGLVYDGMAESLLIRTEDGDAEFLAGHVDYVASLGIGRARIKIDGKDRFASVSGGFVTINDGAVKLVAITFEFAEDIDLERAKHAKEKAQALLSSTEDKKAIELAKLKLARAMSRIDVAKL
ncbi:MAG: ATP synthase F1 subunit epsilon [Eubacteriales bacterium]